MAEQGDMGNDDTPDGTRDEPPQEQTLPQDVTDALVRVGVAAREEVSLRRELEAHLPGYTLYRLLPAARRRWKCQYRIMFGDTYFDCQTVAEAYARALLLTLEEPLNSAAQGDADPR